MREMIYPFFSNKYIYPFRYPHMQEYLLSPTLGIIEISKSQNSQGSEGGSLKLVLSPEYASTFYSLDYH